MKAHSTAHHGRSSGSQRGCRKPAPRLALLSAPLLISVLAAAPVTASETVFGETHAQRCFQSASSTTSSLVAVEACDNALSSEPLSNRDRAATHANRGILLARRSRLEDAIRSYDRAIDLEPALVHALINRGNAWTRLKRFEKALADYDQALYYSQGRDPLVLYNRSLAYEKLGRMAEAREDLVRALQLEPESRQIRDALVSLD